MKINKIKLKKINNKKLQIKLRMNKIFQANKF